MKKSGMKKEKEEIKDSLELESEKTNNFKLLANFINKKEHKENKENKEKQENKNKINYEKKVVKEYLIKNDMGAGTPSYPDNIQDLKDEANNKAKLILKLSDEQNEFKDQLNLLLTKLNILLVEHSEFLKKEDEEFSSFVDKEENIYELKYQLEQRKKDFNLTKNQNKIYKQQYDLLNAKEKNLNNDTIEKRIDKLKNENNELIKQITLLKTQSRLEEKKIKNYSNNGKYLSDINKIMNELKTLESKKHEYFKKYSGNYKLIDTCIKEFENTQ